MMKAIVLALVLAMLVLPVVAFGGLGNSEILLLSPLYIDQVGEEYSFHFWVTNLSEDGEPISTVSIEFPDMYTIPVSPILMGYDYIDPIHERPNWDMGVYLPRRAQWLGSGGQILSFEGTEIWVQVYVPPGFPPGAPRDIAWTIIGSYGSRLDGITQFWVPVGRQSWSAIKALYR